MSRFGARVMKRYGVGEEAARLFWEEARRCEPPLSEQELRGIWDSAARFARRVMSEPGYVPPEEYARLAAEAEAASEQAAAALDGRAAAEQALRERLATGLLPLLTDVEMARDFVRATDGEVLWTPGEGYYTFNGQFFDNGEGKALCRLMKHCDSFLAQVEEEYELIKLAPKGPGKEAAEARNKATWEFALKCREYPRLQRLLSAARPLIETAESELDSDGYLLATPAGVYDLREGLVSRRDATPRDRLTRATSVAPGEDGRGLWEEALATFFPTKGLRDYVQLAAGLTLIGTVKVETMIIAYGTGSNGKSTFWNALARVMGSYAGKISADLMTTRRRTSSTYEIAEMRGRRLLIASELEEGQRLSTSMVKRLCSTDEILAEKKYHDPFVFRPTHTLVLYTNHLPKVGEIDNGTWRRLIVVPFTAGFSGAREVKDYTSVLVNEAGGAILAWAIEGARRIHSLGYHLPATPEIDEATADFREENNWLQHFLDECCLIGEGLQERSGFLYDVYRSFAEQGDDYPHGKSEFYSGLAGLGFKRRRHKQGNMLTGLQVKDEVKEDVIEGLKLTRGR